MSKEKLNMMAIKHREERTIFDNVRLTVIRTDRKSLSLELKPGEVVAHAPLYMDDEDIYGFVETKKNRIKKRLACLADSQKAMGNTEPLTDAEIEELYEKAKQIIPERVKHYAPEIGVTYNKITIRCQRTRWGSCSASGNLSFNCMLALLPAEIIDSVVVHELCHRKHMNHSAEFYAEVKKVLPDYERLDKWLNKNGMAYMARLK